MSEIVTASGGDGWSQWFVRRERRGFYEVEVSSNAEKDAKGMPRVIHSSRDISDGRQAIDKALSVSSAYAYRMYS